MGSAIGAVAGGVGSLFGGGARRREERNAQGQFGAAEAAYGDFQFRNNYLGLENTAEDLTVNQQAAQFQAQQNQQGLAQGLDAYIQTGGGSGGGVTAFANAALTANQGLSADIARQEQQNRQARVAQAQRNQILERQGAERQQAQQFGRIENQYSIASDRLAAAKQARAQATQDLIGGIAGAGTILAGGLIGDAGSFGKNLSQNFGFSRGNNNNNTTSNTTTPAGANIQNQVLTGDNNQLLATGTVGFGPGQFNLLQGF